MPRVYANLKASSKPAWGFIRCEGDAGNHSQTSEHPLTDIANWRADVATDFNRAFHEVVHRDATAAEIADIKAAAAPKPAAKPAPKAAGKGK